MKAMRRHMGFVQTASNSSYRYQDSHLEVDFVRKSASLDSHRLVLTRKEYDLLALLVENAGEIIPRQVQLMRGCKWNQKLAGGFLERERLTPLTNSVRRHRGRSTGLAFHDTSGHRIL